LNVVAQRPRLLTGPVFSRIVETMHTLTAVVFQAPGTKWLVAQNPETGTTTQGRTMDEALKNLREATELYLSEFPFASR